MTKFYLSIFLIVLLLGCKKKPEETTCLTESFDRKEMVSNLTTQYIIPAYNHYVDRTRSLSSKIEVFSSDPTIESLLATRNAWKEVAEAWQNVSFLEIESAENIGLRAQTNLYPVDTTLINSNISSGTVNLELPSNYTAKGIQALDYLLFLPGKSNDNVLEAYEGSSEKRQYLLAISKDLVDNANYVASAWSNQSIEFINNTANNAQGSTVSDIINALSAHYETFVRKGKVGIPVGIFNGFSQTPMPGHVEAYYSEYTNHLLLTQIIAIKKFISGQGFLTDIDGPGFDDYMDFVEAKKGASNLSKAIDDQLSVIMSDVQGLDNKLSDTVMNDAEKGKSLYQSMQKLVPLLKVDLTSALGVLITYQDNDGD